MCSIVTSLCSHHLYAHIICDLITYCDLITILLLSASPHPMIRRWLYPHKGVIIKRGWKWTVWSSFYVGNTWNDTLAENVDWFLQKEAYCICYCHCLGKSYDFKMMQEQVLYVTESGWFQIYWFALFFGYILLWIQIYLNPNILLYLATETVFCIKQR